MTVKLADNEAGRLIGLPFLVKTAPAALSLALHRGPFWPAVMPCGSSEHFLGNPADDGSLVYVPVELGDEFLLKLLDV